MWYAIKTPSGKLMTQSGGSRALHVPLYPTFGDATEALEELGEWHWATRQRELPPGYEIIKLEGGDLDKYAVIHALGGG